MSSSLSFTSRLLGGAPPKIVAVKQPTTSSELKRKVEIKIVKKGNLEDAQEFEKHRQNLKEILQNSNATPIRDHGDTGYACCFCADQYQLPADLKKHNLDEHYTLMNEKTFHGDFRTFGIKLDITNLICKICREKIDTIENLIIHLKTVHTKELFLDIKQQILPFKFSSDNLQCCICLNQFMKFKTLLEHMNSHYKNYVCNICDSGFVSRRKLNGHMRSHKVGTYTCDQCPKVFNTISKKRNHEKQVHEKSMHVGRCGYCYKVFKSKLQKEKHMEKEHGVTSVSRNCRACDKVFSNPSALLVHMKRDHLVQRTHKCQECDKSFFSKSELKFHMIKHSGKRDFKCKVCFKLYTRKWSLSEHMRIHADDRRFKCAHCDLAFVQKCSLQGHMRSKHGDQLL